MFFPSIIPPIDGLGSKAVPIQVWCVELLSVGQANITWALPTADDALGEFDKFEVEIVL